MIERQKLVAFYDDILGQEQRKKDISADIKDAIEAFAKEHDIAVKSLKGDLKKYKEYQKNKEEFVEVDTETDALTQAWCREYQEPAAEEA